MIEGWLNLFDMVARDPGFWLGSISWLVALLVGARLRDPLPVWLGLLFGAVIVGGAVAMFSADVAANDTGWLVYELWRRVVPMAPLSVLSLGLRPARRWWDRQQEVGTTPAAQLAPEALAEELERLTATDARSRRVRELTVQAVQAQEPQPVPEQPVPGWPARPVQEGPHPQVMPFPQQDPPPSGSEPDPEFWSRGEGLSAFGPTRR